MLLKIPLSKNLSFVAADVRRRTFLQTDDLRLLTSMATVRGFKARTVVGRILTLILSRSCLALSPQTFLSLIGERGLLGGEGENTRERKNPVAFRNPGPCAADGRYRISSPLIG